jgi:hypothetical protein
MLDTLKALDFHQMIWLIPCILLLHELEEWNIVHWHQKKAIQVPGETPLSTRMWILFLSLVGFIWTLAAYLLPTSSPAALWIYLLVVFTFLNALQHLAGLFLYRSYNPGLFSACVLGIPAGLLLAWRIQADQLLPTWLLAALLLLILPGLAFTKAMIQGVNRFGIHLAEWISG